MSEPTTKAYLDLHVGDIVDWDGYKVEATKSDRYKVLSIHASILSGKYIEKDVELVACDDLGRAGFPRRTVEFHLGAAPQTFRFYGNPALAWMEENERE